MDKPLSILLVDDHPMFRSGLKAVIHESFPDALIMEAGSVREALIELKSRLPDAALLDISLPDGEGLSLAGEILERQPGCRIFILTMHRRSGLINRAREEGCRGYFLKEGDGSAVINALDSDSSRFLVSAGLEDLLGAVDSASDSSSLYGELTRREKEVFRLLSEGLGYKEVAWKLGISPRTVSVHRYNIFNKLEIRSDVELVKVAREVGLLF